MTSLPHAISPDLAEVDPEFLRRVLMDDEPFFDEPATLPESDYWEPEDDSFPGPDPADSLWEAGRSVGGCGPEELSPDDVAMYAGTMGAFEWAAEHLDPAPGRAG